MGGGYGIPYKDEDTSLNIDEVFSNVSKVFHKFFSGKKIPEFWIEPGRSIVGNTVILLCRVTGIKNSYKNFVGLDAGMETLMRPALYNAYHRIYKIGNPRYDRILNNLDARMIDGTQGFRSKWMGLTRNTDGIDFGLFRRLIGVSI